MSADTEVHYVLPDGNETREDFETLLASMGEYQDTLDRTVRHTVELEDQKGAFFLRLRRTFPDITSEAAAQRAGELMKLAIESHIPGPDRERISKYFAGIVKKGENLYIE